MVELRLLYKIYLKRLFHFMVSSLTIEVNHLSYLNYKVCFPFATSRNIGTDILFGLA